MPRKSLILTNEFPYHIVSRSNNKDWYALPMELCWRIAVEALIKAHSKHLVDIHAFVLMNNHYHMLVSTPYENISQFMQVFNKTFSDLMKRKSNHINKKFGGRYTWSLITNQRYLVNVYRYIFQNPLRAGIVPFVEDYKFSTLNSSLSLDGVSLPIVSNLDESHESLIDWYNQYFSQQDSDMIRRGLKHSYFKLTKHRDSKYISELRYP